MSEIIKVINLKKTYKNGVEAVRAVTFSIDEGEIFGFLGPNGAGKTTTIKTIIGLLRPTDGDVFVDGINVKENSLKIRKLIGYASQETGVDDNLTGEENLRIQASLYHIPKDEYKSRSRELLKMFGLYERRNDLISFYSGGMRKRLDIACALIHRPKILFLDEPTLGLDVQTRVTIWEYIVKLKKEHNMTIFLTTHYMEEADELCDRVAIIDHGEIKALDKPGKLKELIGGDIITFTTKEGDKVERFLNSLKEIPVVKDVKRLPNDIFQIVVSQNGDRLIPRIFEISEKMSVEITSIRLKRPTLDDVYLYFTGRRIRDEEASKEDHAKRRIMMRRSRR